MTDSMEKMKRNGNEYNQIDCLILTSKSLTEFWNWKGIYLESNFLWVIKIMAEMNEMETNGLSNNNNDSEANDDGCDTMLDDPVVKIIRGFPNITDETIRKIKYKHPNTIF